MTKQPRGRRPLSRFAKAIGYSLAAGGLVSVAAFGNAFAVFVCLPLAVGFCAVWFFHRRARRARPARWPTILAGNGLILACLLSLLFLGFECYYRFGCDRTDAMANTLVSIAWSARHVRTNAAGLRDNVEYPNPPPRLGKGA